MGGVMGGEKKGFKRRGALGGKAKKGGRENLEWWAKKKFAFRLGGWPFWGRKPVSIIDKAKTVSVTGGRTTGFRNPGKSKH